MLPKVYITRKLPEALIKPLQSVAEVEMWTEEYVPVPRDVLLEKSKTANGLLTLLSDQVDEELLANSPHLKVVTNLAVGYDNIDVEACKKYDVIPCNTPDVLTDTTADLAFALLLATARRIPEAQSFLKKGEWKEWGPFLMAGADVHHKTIGIIGMGRIGSAVAKRAKGFDMNIIYHNRNRKRAVEEELGAEYLSFDEVLERSDFIVNLTPLTKETKGLFDGKAFSNMKKEAIFINVGRGPIVDESALYDALINGEIAGAGLDVFDREPVSTDHPLLSLDQVVALPHIGSASKETRSAMIKMCCDNLLLTLKELRPLTPIV